MKDIDSILEEREKTHGRCTLVANQYARIKDVLEITHLQISSLQNMSLDMISVKLARILCGDNNYADHWRDIAGYAMLVVKELEKKNK